MTIEHIALHNFRNYARADIEPCPGITVLYGDNAQGKTGVLEAVELCCVGRSHRTARDKEMILWGAPAARVTVTAQRTDGGHEVDVLIPQDAPKEIKVGGRRISRSGELMGHIYGVLFSPEDLRMVKDGPAERRRFIDMELSQLKPSYYYALQKYNRALRHRAALLRDAYGNPSLMEVLPVWDEQLAQSGETILAERRAFLEGLAEVAREIHAAVTGGREVLDLRYKPSPVEGGILEVLAKNRESDIRRGATGVGPHRDDIVFALNGADARSYGSQGQQRTLVLSLKLSELRVMRDRTGEWPVLMLDDVMSELDPKRRRQLLEYLDGVQTLVTCTDKDDLAGMQAGKLLRVEDGRISNE
ncbi:MAG: DNA replication/repair protein RecF [Christensenellales bacterium]|jgi:DNA replication and repair protein RecF